MSVGIENNTHIIDSILFHLGNCWSHEQCKVLKQFKDLLFNSMKYCVLRCCIFVLIRMII